MVANTSITARPIRLVAMLVNTRPIRYCEINIGVAKMFRKLRAHTSSKNAVATPCITRVKKSHSSTAPSSDGTKFIPDVVTVFKYRVMNPQSRISTATHANSGNSRAGLPRNR